MDHATGIAQVGPYYGVGDFLRTVERAWEAHFAEPMWMAAAHRLVKARTPVARMADELLSNMIDGPGGGIVMSHERTAGRRLGRPCFDITGQLGMTGNLDQVELRRHDELLATMAFRLRIEQDRVVGTITSGRIAMTRHTLERIYEREGVPTGGMPAAIRATMADVRRGIALAVSLGLVTRNVSEMPEDGSAPSGLLASVLVPCASGLLVVETHRACVIRKQSPTMRMEARRSGAFMRSPPTDPIVASSMYEGHEILSMPLHTGRTYLSGDILRPEQREYRDIFLSRIAEVDADEISDLVFGVHDQHVKVETIRFESDNRRLLDLLPRCVAEPPYAGMTWALSLGKRLNVFTEMPDAVPRVPGAGHPTGPGST